MPRLVCISDTHLRHELEIPDGDVLVHSGDHTQVGSEAEVGRAAVWLGKLRRRFEAVLAIAGNHDWAFQGTGGTAELMFAEKGITYLQEQAVYRAGLKFYGSPYTPEFCNWAFNVPRGERLAAIWSRIPDDTDVLITHGPPYGHLDGVRGYDGDYGCYGKENLGVITRHVGDRALRDRVDQLKLKAHVFGHIHRPGQELINGTRFVNASIVNENYDPVYPAQVIDI